MTPRRPTLVLASTSRYRRALLDRLRVPHEAVAHRLDEDAFDRGDRTSEELASALATAKAESVADEHPEAFVLGSDQVVDLAGSILGKPGTAEGAVAQLRRLRGRTHRLVTAVALRAPGGAVSTHVDVHRMRIRELDDEAIARYVAADRPLDCCGAYRIESLGISLFEGIDGEDPTAIEGLPLTAVARLLRDAGWTIP